MQNTFEEELHGSEDAAISARKQIGKYFKSYGSSGHENALKHQLMFASRIMHSIAKCELKHSQIYCQIITDEFAEELRPESAAKYWSIYINNLRYFHYSLVTKKEYELASQLFHYISTHKNKLQTDDVCTTIVNLYCNHLYLQNSHLQCNRKVALKELNHVVENLTLLFDEILDRNKEVDLQCKDILQKAMQWLFPSSGLAKINQFFNNLTSSKVTAMFESLFRLYNQQRIPVPAKEEIHQQVQFIIETLDTFFVFDVIDKFQVQLSVLLMKYCRLNSHFQSEQPIEDFLVLLYNYLKLISAQKANSNFQDLITKYCERFKALFDAHSKSVMNHTWFKDLLVFLNTVHTQMQNMTVFACFWKQMTSLASYQAILMLLLETMKLAPCISAETKLNSMKCCTSFRKHIILSFANTALSTFVLYCQNVHNEPKEEKTLLDDGHQVKKPAEDVYIEQIHKPLLLIVSHAFKVIDKMDCIVSTSQDIKLLLTRFKQSALSACTAKQANTCIKLCELFLKISNKLPEEEWPLMLRRIYKAAVQCLGKDPQLVRDTQMCYIASLLQLRNELDLNQIRGQISIYYSDAAYKEDQQRQSSQDQPELPQPPSHERSLTHMFYHTTNPLKPHLNTSRIRLLHWFEVQHTVKYYKSNTTLMQSLVQSSQSYYDFVITIRATKLLMADVPKCMSIHKYLRSKISEACGLSRLERLTYGHTCTKLLQEYQNNRAMKTPLDSKDFTEEQLEQLLLRKEMETMTICNELQYVKLAYDGFRGFEQFYDKFDQEPISSDDALIDWEAIIDDLTTLAQFLQFASYMEYSSHVWLLHYKISQLLLDNFSALRGLTFFCEHSAFYEQNAITSITSTNLKLNKEIQLHLPFITAVLDNLSAVHVRKQNFILLATLQIAYYYARCSKYTYAQMLLQYVEEKHNELPERMGRYDIIMATLDVIRYRLLWKHRDGQRKSKKYSSMAENLLLDQCLIDEIDQTLDRLKEFVFMTGDGLAYNMLITNLALDMAECSANRLYDNFLNALFVVACKCSLQYGFALRMAQVMCTWMWINLQMEYVDAAQTKLKIIEFVMGIKSLKELARNCVQTKIDIKSSAFQPEAANDLMAFNHNTGMEATRRLVQVQLSPIKTGKLELRPDSQKIDLKGYFKYKIDTKSLPQNELLEWTYFTIGCLNARLYFLVEDYIQLAVFYEKGSAWLELRKNDFNKLYFCNVQLMAMQNYANFLRANGQSEKAIQCLTYGLALCESQKSDIDIVYRVNFKLQLIAAGRELEIGRENKAKLAYDKVKKALTFNLSPDDDKFKCEKARRAIRDQMLSSSKKLSDVVVISSGGSSSRKLSTQNPKSQTSSSGNSSPETKRKIIKDKPKFNICEDAIEIIDSDDNNELIDKKSATKNEKKIPRKITKSTKTSKKVNPELNDNQFIDSIDLLDSPTSDTASPVASNMALISSSSSTECLQTKENIVQNDLITKLGNLELSDKPKKLKTKICRSRKLPSLIKKPTAPVIILEDSPSIKTKENAVPKTRTRLRNNKLPDTVTGKTKESSDSSTRTTGRRRRNIVMENNDNNELNVHSSIIHSTSSSTAINGTSSVRTRRHQNI